MNRAAFAAGAAATCAFPTIVRSQNLTTVRIGTFTSETYGLAIYAKEQGIFQHNGLNADVQYLATGGRISGALVGGALDVGCLSMGPVSNAHLRGIPLRLIAPGAIVLSEHATTALVVPKNSPITTAKDLNGKVVATVVLRDIPHVAEAKWIDMNGGDSKTVKFVEMTPSETPAALSAGRIDAGALGEPSLTNTKADFRQIAHIYDAITKRLMISMHGAMSEWLEQNPETARRVVLSFRQAAQWANDNRNRNTANAILASATKIPLDVISKMNHVVYGETLDPGTIQPQIDALSEYKFIDRHFNLSEIVWPGATS